MPKGKKKFIDKSNAVTYQLIHRSQKDPLQADEDASRMVLVTGDELAQAERREKLTSLGIYQLAQAERREKLAQVERREKLTSLGIYYDDEYNYEQHLRNVDDINLVEPDRDVELFRVGATAKSKVTLPVEVLPSAKEEKIGLLELAAPVSGPRLDWDPDIVAALDSDNDEPMDGDLDDDFITMANVSGDEEEDFSDKDVPDRQRQWLEQQFVGGHDVKQVDIGRLEGDCNIEISSDFGSEGDDELGSLQSFSDDDAKTRFTNYSMSSSVIRRSEGLTLLDDKFERLYAEYDEDEIGALDHEDIDGKVSTTGPMMEYLLQQFQKQEIQEGLPEPMDQRDLIEICSDVESSEDDEVMVPVVVDESHTNKWDCESILSTYSNKHNLPKLIETPGTKKKLKKIELTKKLGIPVESLAPKGLTRKQLQELDKQTGGVEKIAPVRRKEETAEEKRLRKAMVKDERKERRVEKKNTKTAFRQEEISQRRQQIGAANNLSGHKIL